MILEKLVLENFRQFLGRQEFYFSDLKEKNVTIIHAENGFGKTTLLKALLWGLYGRLGLMGTDGKPDDFEKPDRIIHEGTAYNSQDPEQAAASVKITFKHNDDRYVLTRKLTLAQQNVNPKQSKLTLEVIRDGQTLRLERPQHRIEAIVPEGIRKFLFFNGERINYLAMEENSSEIKEAIHQMLGLKILKITIDDLKNNNVRGKLRNEQKNSTSEEKKELIDKVTELENNIHKFQDDRKQIYSNIQAIKDEITTVDNKLTANQEAKKLQAKRTTLQEELEDLKQKLSDVNRRLSKLISTDGFTLFSNNLVIRGREIVNKLRSEGKIPARVLNTFLQELLENEKCICNRSLEEGSDERKAVEDLLTIAGDQEFNNAVGALENALGHIEGVEKQTKENLNQLKSERLVIKREIREHDEELEDIHQTLGGKKDDEIQDLEAKRRQLELDQVDLSTKDGEYKEKINRAIEEKESIEKQIRQIKDKEEAGKRAQRRVDAVEDCIEILQNILEVETENLRPLLNREIDKHFRQIMTKDYWAELTEGFFLRIRKHVVGESEENNQMEIDAALSTGERTVTSLVFIASLLALARKRSEIPTILKGLTGSAFPVAIDSPFGSLSIFRSGVAHYIPELAPQVILFVSPEQYDGQVEKALNQSGRVGKRYYLEYHGPTIPYQANPELEVHSQKIQQYFSSKNEEYTVIREL